MRALLPATCTPRPRPGAAPGLACTTQCRPPASSRRTSVRCQAAKTHYEVLEIPQTATDKEIKAAYRRKALKLHPDVNKAKDAKERFLEAKTAFETLSDSKARADYDRRLRGGFGTSSGTSADFDFGAYARARRPGTAPQQDDLGLDELLNDLGKELDSWLSGVEKKRGGSKEPDSLLNELAAIGEEFVEFFEESLGIKAAPSSPPSSSGASQEKGGASGSRTSANGTNASSSTSGGGGGRPRNPIEEYEQLKAKYGDAFKSVDTAGPSSAASSSGSTGSRTAANGSGSSAANSSSSSSKKDDDIDEMLAALKRKHNRA